MTEEQIKALLKLKGNQPFEGISDFLPFLEDVGFVIMKANLEELAGSKNSFSLRSAARLKKAIREAAGMDAVQPDMHEVQGKLQRVGDVLMQGGEIDAADALAKIDALAKVASKEMSFHRVEARLGRGRPRAVRPGPVARGVVVDCDVRRVQAPGPRPGLPARASVCHRPRVL